MSKRSGLILAMILMVILGAITVTNHLSEKKTAAVLKAPSPSNPSKATNTPSAATVDSNTVSFVVDEWAPFTSQKLEKYGLCSEIVSEAAREAGLKVEFKFAPWSRALEMTKFGDAWGTFPWFYTEERKKNYLFSDALMQSKVLVFYHKDNPNMQRKVPPYKGLVDLKSYKFGGVSGYYYEDIFEKEKFKFKLSYTLDGAYRQLRDNQVDLIVEDENVGWSVIKTIYPNNYKEFATLEKSIEEKEMFLMVTKQDPNATAKLKRFNEGLATIRKNGTYDDIMKRRSERHN